MFLLPNDVLSLRVIKATNLIAADINGKSDPYVIVATSEGGEKNFKKTEIIKKTLNPNWNEKFNFYFYEKNEKFQLFFKVMDKDTVSKDDFLGSAVVNVLDVVKEVNKEFTIDLPLQKVKSGVLQICLFIERQFEENNTLQSTNNLNPTTIIEEIKPLQKENKLIEFKEFNNNCILYIPSNFKLKSSKYGSTSQVTFEGPKTNEELKESEILSFNNTKIMGNFENSCKLFINTVRKLNEQVSKKQENGVFEELDFTTRLQIVNENILQFKTFGWRFTNTDNKIVNVLNICVLSKKNNLLIISFNTTNKIDEEELKLFEEMLQLISLQ
ncbi:hypothetical protein ABK040_011680 [Willaertia magna]